MLPFNVAQWSGVFAWKENFSINSRRAENHFSNKWDYFSNLPYLAAGMSSTSLAFTSALLSIKNFAISS